MKATIHISGSIGGEDGVSLLDVIRQYKAFENPTLVHVVINSIGGSVNVGDSIYDYLKGLDIPVTTIGQKYYSSAAKIFCAGSIRLAEGKGMLHMPIIANLTGNSDALTYVAGQLKTLEKEFTAFYTDVLDIKKETVTALLKAETFIDPIEAVELGIATGIKQPELEAVAFYDEENTPTKNTTMSKADKLFNAMAAYFKPEFQAIQITDATGEILDFPDTDVSPIVGDKGKDSEGKDLEGDRIIETDGITSTYSFEKGEVMTIVEVEEETEEAPDADTDVDAQATEITQLSKWEISVVNETFAIGDKVEYKPSEEGEEPTIVSSGEYELSDGRKILVDSDGVIQLIKDAPTDAPTEEDVEAILKDVEAKFEAKYTEKVTALEAEIVALNKNVSSADIDAQAQETNKKTNSKLPKSASILATLK